MRAVHVLHPLFVHVAGALTEVDQQELLHAIEHTQQTPAPYRYGFDKLFAGDTFSAPLDDTHAAAMAKLVQPVAPDMPWPFACGLTECLGYKRGAALAPHVDHVDGINIIVSLGATANFAFRVGDNGALQNVKMRSGDAVVFPADGASNVWHRIESFDDDVPDWFDAQPYVRICVQYRQAAL